MSYATSLYLTASEIGLSITALVLLLLAAWNGDRSARLLTIIAVAALVGAAIFSIGLFDRSASEVAGRAFGDLYRAVVVGAGQLGGCRRGCYPDRGCGCHRVSSPSWAVTAPNIPC